MAGKQPTDAAGSTSAEEPASGRNDGATPGEREPSTAGEGAPSGRASGLRFDLQAHSTYSDGELGPAKVVAAAAAAGVELMALTDHDTIEGVPEALASAREHGVRLVPAVEISAVDDGREPARELHILGYRIDHASPDVARLLGEFVADRRRRTLRMAEALQQEGFALDEEAVWGRADRGLSIGRLHLAEAALGRPENAQRLRAEGIEDVGGFIRSYLVEGTPAYRMRETPTVAEAVRAIHDAGGIAIWAHPFWDLDAHVDVRATIERFHALGIDGVEAFYITHTREQTDTIVELCERLDLLTTGSADFHGPQNSLFSRFLAFDTYGHEPHLGAIASE
jgi:predicted metal-dependent phosphoesterase TrpH